MATVENIAEDYCPQCIQDMYDESLEILDDLRRRGEEKIAELELSHEINNVCISVLRTIPETILCAAAFFSVPYVSTPLWAMKLISLLTPAINDLLNCNLSIQTGPIINNVWEFTDRLRPGLVLSAAIACACYTALCLFSLATYFPRAMLCATVVRIAVPSLIAKPIPESKSPSEWDVV